MPRWEHFSHGSDIGVRGFGATPDEAFEGAALALTSVAADLSRVAPVDTIEVACEAPDLDLLLMSWLNTVIYEMAVRGMLFSEFHVAISGHSLAATLRGEKVDPERHLRRFAQHLQNRATHDRRRNPRIVRPPQGRDPQFRPWSSRFARRLSPYGPARPHRWHHGNGVLHPGWHNRE